MVIDTIYNHNLVTRDCFYGEEKEKGFKGTLPCKNIEGKSFDVHPRGHTVRILQGLKR